MYAQKAVPRPDSYIPNLPKGPKPVFLRSTNVRNIDEKPLAGKELYLSVANTEQKDNIVGIQQIRNLWRIYLNSHDDRVRVIMPWSHLCVKSPRMSHVLKRNCMN